jgi:hypothetical protein
MIFRIGSQESLTGRWDVDVKNPLHARRTNEGSLGCSHEQKLRIVECVHECFE